MKFIYCKNPNDEIPILVIDQHIGESEALGRGIDGTQFLNEVFELKKNGVKAVDVLINTPGGSMKEAYNIRSACELAGIEMNTLNYGMAASSGGWIWLKGKKVRMTPGAIFMCHNPSGGDEDKHSSEQRAFTFSAATLISEGSGRNGIAKIPVEEAERMMNETTFLTAEDCLRMGLCDEVIPEGDFRDNYKPIDAMDFFTAGNNILNSLLPNNTTMANETNLLLITNELELGEDASSKDITKSIKALKTKANLADTLGEKVKTLEATVTDLTKVKNEMEDSATEKDNAHKADLEKLNAMEDDCKNLRAKVDEYDNKMKEAEAEAEKEKANKAEADCVNMVNSYVGKIGSEPEVIAMYVEMAKTTGIEKVKNALELMPMHKAGTKINQITKPAEGGGGKKPSTSMADAMARQNEQLHASRKK